MMISEYSILENILKPINVHNISAFRPVAGFSFDSRSIKEGEAFIALKGKDKDGHDFIQDAIKRGASLIISQHNMENESPVPFLIVKDTRFSLKLLVQYIRKVKNPFVYAITGSIGKTTTKEMLSFLLDKYRVRKNFKTENNIFGVAKTFFGLQDEKIVVLEFGTNSPGEIKELAEMSLPDIGIITFIKPVHLEGLESLRGIFEEKLSLCKANHTQLVLNRDDPYLRKVDYPKIYWIGKRKDSNLSARLIAANDENSIFLVQDKFKLILNTPFSDFIYNAMLAIGAANMSGESLESLVGKMNSFKLPAMRMEFHHMDGLTVINDAYNANPYSLRQALRMINKLPAKKIAVIGDMRELGKRSRFYHRSIAGDIVKNNFEYCLLLGEDVLHLKERLLELGYKSVYHFSSNQDIANFLKENIRVKLYGDSQFLLFLKGSRKMELEKVIEYLRNE